MNTRTHWVDYAKALGIILVVYGHVMRGLFNGGVALPEHLYRLSDSIVYSFHMPLFFFLSGLFFYASLIKRGGVKLTLNKLDTIIYPYLLWSILQGSVEVVMSNYTNGNLTGAEVVQLWQPRAQFWFLYALFFVFAVSAFALSLASEKYTPWFFLFACCLYLAEPLLPEVQTLLFIANYWVYFVFGIVFTQYKLGHYLADNRALLLAVLSFVACQYLFHGYLGKSYADRGYESLILACLSLVFVVSLSMAITKIPSRLLAWIGASSMAIYLMHILVGSGIRVALSQFLGIDNVLVHILAGCLMGVFLPLLALKMIDRLNIPYIFAAPLSHWLGLAYNAVFQRMRH